MSLRVLAAESPVAKGEEQLVALGTQAGQAHGAFDGFTGLAR